MSEKIDHKSFFKGTIKICFIPKDNLNLNRNLIFNGLVQANIPVKNIIRITQFKNNFTWLIGFKSNFNINSLINREVTIQNKNVFLKYM